MKRKFLFCYALILFSSCDKFVDKKSDSGLNSPRNVTDYRNMLQNDLMTVKCTPGLGPLGSDDVTLSASALQATMPAYVGIYSWNPNLYQGATDGSWANPYLAIYQANVVLEGLKTIPYEPDVDSLRSWALYDRAFYFYNLEETYGWPWRPGSATTDDGIPLRLNNNAMQRSTRARVQEVFDRIVQDLQDALPNLPVAPQMLSPDRPCQPAAWALLARVALIRQDFATAKTCADNCLHLYSRLIDYDTVKGMASHPFYAVGNPEVLFQCSSVAYPALYSSMTGIDSTLYASYNVNDLRRTLFFETNDNGQNIFFKGYYSLGHFIFGGIATDEVFLIRSECLARMGDEAGALADLNTLLTHRWKPGTFVPYVAGNSGDVLQLVLNERRKETLFRELRWSDRRRLNSDPRFAVSIIRKMGDAIRELSPTSGAYAWQIPKSETDSSHIPQNPPF